VRRKTREAIQLFKVAALTGIKRKKCETEGGQVERTSVAVRNSIAELHCIESGTEQTCEKAIAFWNTRPLCRI
jgi:hypothetical protein